MTWVIHKGDRSQIFNTDMSQSVTVGKMSVVENDEAEEWAVTIWFGSTPVQLEYPNEKDAQQAFKYLMEAIKRGEKLTHI